MIYFFYLALSIFLEVVANILLKKSHGFQRKKPAIIAILFALGAFTALSFAVKVIPLAVAYSIWGAIGLIATAIIGITLFGERLQPKGWVGILLLIFGVVLMKLG